ncbi:MmcQ/YjbR family DNA-binding protein [Agromyces atrinae]|uniref:MmcQ/YjbR family DNA-binding protein n=1 Tax=Agromyces atrinae TaxID=592376 RepID=UPI001F55EB75|nr:MmcQ/YjbR family DNA-binding protein [Agromyces atrinae]MCI2957230.1 MmcQ/YjbR family DNA-binding protein [Agromyces atrinae]
MEHPQVVDPRHPLIERVRAICSELPECTEVEAWGRPTFRTGAKGKIFVHVSSSMDDPFSVVFKTDPDEHQALAQDPRFYAPPYYDKNHWLGIGLDGVDWDELAELIETSYRQVALKRQIRALDELRPDHAR